MKTKVRINPLDYHIASAAHDYSGISYKPKDPKAYELRKRRKALKIKLELQGLDEAAVALALKALV